MIEIQDLRRRIERRKGKKATIEQYLSRERDAVKTHRMDVRDYKHSLLIIKEVALKTQQQLQYHISDITSLALDAVFPDPYELVVEFVKRRGKTECDLWFQRNDKRSDPETASGGGAVDVASFALRVASWSMERPRSRNVIILDEPMKFVSQDLREKASEMIKEISQELGIQFIIVTHQEELTAQADQVFQVGIKKGKSHVQISD